MKTTGVFLRGTALMALCSASLAAQDTTANRRPDSVASAARAPRVTYVPKRSRADSLRGSYTSAGRRWWDVTFYDLHVSIQPKDSSIAGWNAITYRVIEPPSGEPVDRCDSRNIGVVVNLFPTRSIKIVVIWVHQDVGGMRRAIDARQRGRSAPRTRSRSSWLAARPNVITSSWSRVATPSATNRVTRAPTA